MYQTQAESLSDECIRYQYSRGNDILSFAEVIQLWQTDAAFRAVMLQDLRDSSFAAYFWECPPVTSASLSQPFKCI